MQQVDDARQLVLRADRQLDRHAALRQLLLDGGEHAEEVGALAVEHVHEDDAREPELLGAVPHARRVHLDAHHAGDDDERAFDDAQRGDRVGLEAGVARRVDQVDLAALPLAVAERRGERHLPAVLVLLPVGDRRAGFDLPEPVRLSRLEEQRLDERGLSRPAVADDGDVADLPGFDGHRVLLGCERDGRRESYARAAEAEKRANAAITTAANGAGRDRREPRIARVGAGEHAVQAREEPCRQRQVVQLAPRRVRQALAKRVRDPDRGDQLHRAHAEPDRERPVRRRRTARAPGRARSGRRGRAAASRRAAR